MLLGELSPEKAIRAFLNPWRASQATFFFMRKVSSPQNLRMGSVASCQCLVALEWGSPADIPTGILHPTGLLGAANPEKGPRLGVLSWLELEGTLKIT